MGWLGDLLKGGVTLGATALGGPLAGGVVGGVLSGAGKGAKADSLNKRRLGIADERYAAGAPFRSKLAETAFAIPEQREDLSSIFADAGDPYSRVAPRPMTPTTATPTAPVPRAPMGMGRSRSPLSRLFR